MNPAARSIRGGLVGGSGGLPLHQSGGSELCLIPESMELVARASFWPRAEWMEGYNVLAERRKERSRGPESDREEGKSCSSTSCPESETQLNC